MKGSWKEMKQILRNSQDGFSLLGVVIAAGIGLALIATVGNYMLGVQRQVATIEGKMDAANLSATLAVALNNVTTCTSSLQNSVIVPGNTTNLLPDANFSASPLGQLAAEFNGGGGAAILSELNTFRKATKLDGNLNNTNPYEFDVTAVYGYASRLSNQTVFRRSIATITLDLGAGDVINNCVSTLPLV